MRIVTWNCNRGPAGRKLPRIASLDPTITVLQECPRLGDDHASSVWFGENPRQGIAVLASHGYRLSPAPIREAPRYCFPVRVSGPSSFLLLAVWAKTDPQYEYVKAVIRAVDVYADMIVAEPTVLIGDFNSNAQWDHKRSSDKGHTALVRQLGALRMVSAYHSFLKLEHGAEMHPTLYMLKKADRPYHIDYCFVPERWASHVRTVVVGTYDDWISFSDHCPLTVDINPENLSHHVLQEGLR